MPPSAWDRAAACCSARKCAALLRPIGTSSLWWLPALLQRAEVRCSIETSGKFHPNMGVPPLQRAEVRCSIETVQSAAETPGEGWVAARGSALLY